jgi:hypothetical protein
MLRLNRKYSHKGMANTNYGRILPAFVPVAASIMSISTIGEIQNLFFKS